VLREYPSSEENTVTSREGFPNAGGTRKSVRIVVVDDYEPWHHFVLTTLRREPGLQIIGHLLDGLDVVQKAEELQPDLILLDIGLPTLNGIEAARRIRKVAPASKILFVSANRSPDIAEQALSTGAGGYVVKSDAACELLPAVEAVLQGKRFVSASLAGHHLVASEGRHQIEDNPYLRFLESAAISEFLSSVIESTAADFATLQLFDSNNRVLRIVAQRGFQGEFLDYFDTVGCDDAGVCGVAMNGRSRVVVTDVATDPLLTNDSRGVLLRANVHSVQATPLIDPLGKLVGILSTHYSRPAGATPEVLEQVDDFAAKLLVKING